MFDDLQKLAMQARVRERDRASTYSRAKVRSKGQAKAHGSRGKANEYYYCHSRY